MATGTTKITDLINPQVMSDMISAKIPNKVVVTPFAAVDTTLQGQAGDTITVPVFDYIGDAEDVAEGNAVTATKLTATSAQYKIKKAMKAVTLTDEAVLSGYGDPVGQATGQVAKAIASKADSDAMDILTTEYNASTAPNGVKLIYAPATASAIKYAHIVNAVDLFDEEVQSEKVLFIHPKQVTQLRLDPDFINADKYNNEVMMKGEIGMVSGCRVVPSRRVKTSGSGSSALYLNPIVKLTNDEETEEDIPALTIYLKRDVNVETERHTLSRTTDISADELYCVALTDQSKVVLMKSLVTPSA